MESDFLENEYIEIIALREKGQYDQAIELLLERQKTYPNEAIVYCFLAHCYVLKNEIEKAVLNLEYAQNIDPDNALVGWNSVRVLMKRKLLAEALQVAQSTHQRFPNDSEGLGVLGACLRANGNSDEGLLVLNKAIELNAANAEALINRALILLAQSEKRLACEDLKKAYQIKPHLKQIWDILTSLQIDLADFSAAIPLLEKMSLDPTSPAETYAKLALCYQKLERWDEAIKAYEKAININPGLSTAHNNMGIILKNQGKLDEALDAFENAIKIQPDFAEPHFNMGNVLKELKKYNEAAIAYDSALKHSPGDVRFKLAVLGLLKSFTPHVSLQNSIFINDLRIKDICQNLIKANTTNEVSDIVSEALSLIDQDPETLKLVKSTQITKSNGQDLNCNRHMKLFNTKNVIPKFCFSCFKIQIEVNTLIDLIKLTSIFYCMQFKPDLIRKTMIELRPNIGGSYKGLIYCGSVQEAASLALRLSRHLKSNFDDNFKLMIKRGCSEYAMKFPAYGEVGEDRGLFFEHPDDWNKIEIDFDREMPPMREKVVDSTLVSFCLRDLCIIQTWIDYAKGIGDPTSESFAGRPVIFQEIYKAAKERINLNT